VTEIQVKVCGQKLNLERLESGQNQVLTFEITSDCHYAVSASLASGKKLKAKLGYVTHGFDFEDTIILTDEKITLKEKTSDPLMH